MEILLVSMLVFGGVNWEAWVWVSRGACYWWVLMGGLSILNSGDRLLLLATQGWGMVCCGGALEFEWRSVSQFSEKAEEWKMGCFCRRNLGVTALILTDLIVNLSWISAHETKGIIYCSSPNYLYYPYSLNGSGLLVQKFPIRRGNFLPGPHWLRPWSFWTMTCMSRLGEAYCVDGLRHCVLQRGMFLLLIDADNFVFQCFSRVMYILHLPRQTSLLLFISIIFPDSQVKNVMPWCFHPFYPNHSQLAFIPLNPFEWNCLMETP